MSLERLIYSTFLPLAKITLVALTLLVLRGGWWLVSLLIVLPKFDPLRDLPGPEGAAMQSMMREVLDPKVSPRTHEEWHTKFGKTFRFHGLGRHDYRLLSLDFQVVSHVLMSPLYEKPWQTRAVLSRLIGRGIFSMEGPEHKFQRKLIGPAFSTQSIRNMVPIFVRKANQLCDQWCLRCSSTATVHQSDGKGTNGHGAVIDVLHWISRASFDVIGLSGFDYEFNSLDDESEAVYSAYRSMFDVLDKGSELRAISELYFPIIRTLWPDERTKVTNKSLGVIAKAGKNILQRKKAAVLAEASGCVNEQKDILSLLIKANSSSGSPQRLSDPELLDQCSTFLLAGSDSVSLAISWTLHYLSLHPSMQGRLRNEIVAQIHGTCLDMVDDLPYLDAVVRETLRFCPPVHSSIRVATKDDYIPVSEQIVMKDGTVIQPGEKFRIRRGSYVHIPIEGLNLSTDIWGDDALVFNPNRWLTGKPTPTITHPGLGNSMTFGFGPSSCLGYKFTIYQMKAFLATILPLFSFAPAEGVEISKYNSILTRPFIKDKWEFGTQLPLLVQLHQDLDKPNLA